MFSFSSNKNSGGKIERCSFATQQKQSSSENQLRSFGTSKKW